MNALVSFKYEYSSFVVAKCIPKLQSYTVVEPSGQA